jgi:hypothetical protein
MPSSTLAAAVAQFAQATMDIADADLARDYAWRYHDEEGLRFALIGTYHELRDLAATTAAERAVRGRAITLAQRALAQYHAGYRDLQAILLGVSHADAGREPAPGEWPLWIVLWHIIRSEQQFFPRCRYAAEKRRAGAAPSEMSEDERQAFLAAEPATDQMRLLKLIYGDAIGTPAEAERAPDPERLHGTFEEQLACYDALHERVLRDLSTLSDDDVQAPSIWWEEAEVPVRYRLHRLDAHVRQHAIQAEKTLDMLGRSPNEARRLLRLIYAALAEAEGAALGAEGPTPGWDEVAAGIAARAEEVTGLIG